MALSNHDKIFNSLKTGIEITLNTITNLTKQPIILRFQLGMFDCNSNDIITNVGRDFILKINKQLCSSTNWDQIIHVKEEINTSVEESRKYNQNIIGDIIYNYTSTPFDIKLDIFDIDIRDDIFTNATNAINETDLTRFFIFNKVWYFYTDLTNNRCGIICDYSEALRTRTPFYTLHSGFLKIRDIINMVEEINSDRSMINFVR